jgi:hypothetical protein
MKKTDKGLALSINAPNAGGTSFLNSFKRSLTITPPAPIREFRPFVPPKHPRSAEMAAYRAIPSWKP